MFDEYQPHGCIAAKSRTDAAFGSVSRHFGKAVRF